MLQDTYKRLLVSLGSFEGLARRTKPMDFKDSRLLGELHSLIKIRAQAAINAGYPQTFITHAFNITWGYRRYLAL